MASRLAALALVPLVLLPLAVPAQAALPPGSFVFLTTAPPIARNAATAYDGVRFTYLFGGSTSPVSDDIWRHDRFTGATVLLPTTLPKALEAASAVWANGAAYVFGGVPFSSTDVVRFDPVAGTATVLPLKMPYGIYDSAAVFDGTDAYIFGGGIGWNGGGAVMRFNPATGATVQVPIGLPREFGMSAVWTGTRGLIFGGMGGSTPSATDDILAFDVTAVGPVKVESLSVLPITLSSARSATAAVWDGSHAYVFGGATFPGGVLTGAVEKVDPVAMTIVPAVSISPIAALKASTSGTCAFLFHDSSVQTYGDPMVPC